MSPCASQPRGDGGLSVAEDPRGRRKIQPFGQRREHLRRGFQTVQRRPEYGHWRLGQANPSVSMRLGAPRRLFTSGQGRTGAGAGSPLDEVVEARRQAGQASGLRGLSRRWSVVRLAPPSEEEGRRGNQSRRHSSVREKEADHEQEHVHMKGHHHPRCWKWGAWRAP